MVGGVGGHEFDVAAAVDAVAQVAAPHLVAGEDGVGVRVDEAGQEGAALQIDGLAPAERTGRPGRADLRDPSVCDPDTGSFGEEGCAVEDGAVMEDHLFADGHAWPP